MAQSQAQGSGGVQSDPTFQGLMNPIVAGALLSPAAGQPIVPSNEELQALVLLSKFDDDNIIRSLARKDLAFVRGAARLLETDPYLRQQLGGAGFRSVLKLSGLMKSQFNDEMLKARTQRMMPMLLDDLGFNNSEVNHMIKGVPDSRARHFGFGITGLANEAARAGARAGQDPAEYAQRFLGRVSAATGNSDGAAAALGPRSGMLTAGQSAAAQRATRAATQRWLSQGAAGVEPGWQY